jgi:tetratricopeptide (TPR) repeat protein
MASTTATPNTAMSNTASTVPPAGVHPQVRARQLFAAATHAHGAGKLAAALLLYQRALACWPQLPDAHANLGHVLFVLERLDEAETAYREALVLQPDHPGVHNNLGVVLMRTGRLPQAQAAYQRAVVLRPDYGPAWTNLAIVLQRQGALHAAVEVCRRALLLRANDALAWATLGQLLTALGQPADAEVALGRAILLRPDDAVSLTHLGNVLVQRARPDEAEAAYRRALSIRADLADTWGNLGHLLHAQARMDEAEQACRRAVALRAEYPEALNTLGTVLCDQGQLDEAQAHLRAALALRPGWAQAQTNLALTLLAAGQTGQGWTLYEARYGVSPTLSETRHQLLTRAKSWQGEALHGRSILVWPEQGYGDCIQFARYVGLLKARGAARVTLACEPSLLALMQSLSGVDACIPAQNPEHVPDHDYVVFLMSLPGLLGAPPEGLTGVPYLTAAPEHIRQWDACLPVGRPRVGLVWAGNPANAADQHRSIPLTSLRPLLGCDATFVSLQKDGAGRGSSSPIPALCDPMPHVRDFADTAAILASLDLVIAVDTAVVHLAGALGRPVWVLARFGGDWRWPAGREDSPWYPSARVFKQTSPRDWETVIARAAQALREHLAGCVSGVAPLRQLTGRDHP